jgi:hypothetical protein
MVRWGTKYVDRRTSSRGGVEGGYSPQDARTLARSDDAGTAFRCGLPTYSTTSWCALVCRPRAGAGWRGWSSCPAGRPRPGGGRRRRRNSRGRHPRSCHRSLSGRRAARGERAAWWRRGGPAGFLGSEGSVLRARAEGMACAARTPSAQAHGAASDALSIHGGVLSLDECRRARRSPHRPRRSSPWPRPDPTSARVRAASRRDAHPARGRLAHDDGIATP